MPEHEHEYRFAFICSMPLQGGRVFRRQHYTCQTCLHAEHRGGQDEQNTDVKTEVQGCY